MKRFAISMLALAAVAPAFAQSWSLDTVSKWSDDRVQTVPVVSYKLGTVRDVPIIGNVAVLSFAGADRTRSLAGFAAAKEFDLGRDLTARLGGAWVTEPQVRPGLRLYAGVSVRL